MYLQLMFRILQTCGSTTKDKTYLVRNTTRIYRLEQCPSCVREMLQIEKLVPISLISNICNA